MVERFNALQIQQTYIEQLQSQGIEQPTEIQSLAIPIIMTERDVVIQSHTGSGKTLAYLLPALQRIEFNLKSMQVLIVVPTHELGMQIYKVAEKLIQGNSIRTQVIIGGAAIHRQIEKLKEHPHLIVGTPGRLLELMKLNKLKLHEVKLMIIDEVDQVFQLSSTGEIEILCKSVQKSKQFIFVSATIPPSLTSMVNKWLKDPIFINTKILSHSQVAETIDHQYIMCDQRDKIDTLRKSIRVLNPRSAIVFVNQVEHIAEIVAKIQHVGLTIQALYAEAEKQEREQTMNAFKQGKFQILLATDMLSRGIDLDHVTHIFHLDPATDGNAYVHRVGRTGRMGKLGTSISIITQKELFVLKKFEKALHIVLKAKTMSHGKWIDVLPNSSKNLVKVFNNKMKSNVEASNQAIDNQSKTLKNKQNQTQFKSSKKKKITESEQKNKGIPKWLKAKQISEKNL